MRRLRIAVAKVLCGAGWALLPKDIAGRINFTVEPSKERPVVPLSRIFPDAE